nr:hypothetical protein [Massilicoli timonensis]
MEQITYRQRRRQNRKRQAFQQAYHRLRRQNRKQQASQPAYRTHRKRKQGLPPFSCSIQRDLKVP